MEEQDVSMSGHSAYDYQFICQTIGSLYLDWLNTRRQAESVYAPRIEELQKQVSELVSENEKLKSSSEIGYDNVDTSEIEEEQNEPDNG